MVDLTFLDSENRSLFRWVVSRHPEPFEKHGITTKTLERAPLAREAFYTSDWPGARSLVHCNSEFKVRTTTYDRYTCSIYDTAACMYRTSFPPFVFSQEQKGYCCIKYKGFTNSDTPLHHCFKSCLFFCEYGWMVTLTKSMWLYCCKYSSSCMGNSNIA